MPRLRHILIANRGEIAWRILRTARALGYRTTAVYSEADAAAPYLAQADHTVCIGPAAVGASYLNSAAILEAARKTGADALHPGYGLLSENADFADAVRAAGLCFIGPSGAAIRALGDKRSARIAARRLGVPCVPGYDGAAQDEGTLQREAELIGFPLMVKAAAGGGGRGMRRVERAEALREAITRASSEAQQAFGDGRLILERAVQRARHIEIQVFADRHGHVIHLAERDCSLQRRFQKVVEEAPSPAVDAELRARLGAAAVLIARSAGYEGAGTVELLLEANGEFYFLEMNTRLQVEHPVTESITGLDLVAWQIRIAEGEALPLTQAEVALQGHAIEARLYAEKPAQAFAPATGRILQLALPTEFVRVDHALAPGLTIAPHYDAMLAKLIAHAGTREQARLQLLAALEHLRVLGVATNQAFLRELLEGAAFASGAATTETIDSLGPVVAPLPELRSWASAAVLFVLRDQQLGNYPAELRSFSNRESVAALLVLECEGHERVLRVAARHRTGVFEILADEQPITLETRAQTDEQLEIVHEGQSERIAYAFDDATLHLQKHGRNYVFSDRSYAPKQRSTAAGSSRAVAPMDGNLIGVLVKPGDAVEAGQTLAVVEAMKLELRVTADVPGLVAHLHARAGTQVKAGQLLVELEARPEA